MTHFKILTTEQKDILVEILKALDIPLESFLKITDINELFEEFNALKKEMSSLKKENESLKIEIESLENYVKSKEGIQGRFYDYDEFGR